MKQYCSPVAKVVVFVVLDKVVFLETLAPQLVVRLFVHLLVHVVDVCVQQLVLALRLETNKLYIKKKRN